MSKKVLIAVSVTVFMGWLLMPTLSETVPIPILQGTVSNAASGAPIAGANVCNADNDVGHDFPTPEEEGLACVDTNANGNYYFDMTGKENQACDLWVKAVGYNGHAELFVQSSGTVVKDIALSPLN